MGKDLDKLFAEIDNLPIYKRDFDVISSILDSGDPKLFSVIMESVISGDLYWSDFEKILENTNYNDFVLKSLESQNKIKEELSRMSALRSDMLTDRLPPKFIALGKSTDNTTKENEAYDIESSNMRDNILYELSRISEKDTDLSILCKLRLYNYILNYENNIDTDEKINPDDIFLFINDLLIPIDSRYQVLDSTDKLFMSENNLSEEEMKKYKSVAFFLRQLEYSSRG